MGSPLEIKDYLAVGISIIGLIVSATTLYLTQFRQSRIRVRIGPDIHLYYDPGGTPGIYLPVLFQNRSPARGIVEKAYLVVRNPEGTSFGMKWQDRVNITWPGASYSHQGKARPFKLDGFDAVVEAYWFLHPRVPEVTPLNWVKGVYEATLYVWTKGGVEPDATSSETFELTKEAAEVLAHNLAENITTTRYFFFRNRGFISFVTQLPRPSFADQRTD